MFLEAMSFSVSTKSNNRIDLSVFIANPRSFSLTRRPSRNIVIIYEACIPALLLNPTLHGYVYTTNLEKSRMLRSGGGDDIYICVYVYVYIVYIDM